MLSPSFRQIFYAYVKPGMKQDCLFICLSSLFICLTSLFICLSGLFICQSGISGVLSALVCQPTQKTLRCPPGDEIVIDTVFYGRTNQNLCNPGHTSFNNLNCIGGAKSNDTVHLYCDHQASCIVHADNSWLGVVDPCPGIPKYLQVNTYSESVTRNNFLLLIK